MGCEHFPLIDAMDIPESTKVHYARITHESHPRHLAYRRDIEARAAGLAFERHGPCSESPATTIGEATPAAIEPTITRSHNGDDPEADGRFAGLLRLVNECDYRGAMIKGEAGCGCERTWHCAMRKGPFVTNPFEVSKSTCINCVQERYPA